MEPLTISGAVTGLVRRGNGDIELSVKRWLDRPETMTFIVHPVWIEGLNIGSRVRITLEEDPDRLAKRKNGSPKRRELARSK